MNTKNTFSKKINISQNKEHKPLSGIYKQMPGGFGFVDVFDDTDATTPRKKDGFFVHESKKLDALEGDTVAFKVRKFKGRNEAIITKILKRSDHLVVGRLHITNTTAFVIPETGTMHKDVFIPLKHIRGHTHGSRVAVHVLHWKGKNPEGRIIESLESLPEGRDEIYKIAFEMGARKTFSPKVVVESQRINTTISSDEIHNRKDLRDMFTYTIDGAESKDLDDAISIEVLYSTPTSSFSKKGEEQSTEISGYKLYVHIADVTHYVRENSALDREARKRATSIYLVDQVIPMLPSVLSNGVASLHPGEDRLTLTCEIHLDAKGNIKNTQVYESVIHSDFRLTYREVDQIISKTPTQVEMEDIHIGDTLQFGGKLTEQLSENIQLLSSLTDILSQKTYKRGALAFDFPETRIVLDEKGYPIEYKKHERYSSYKIVEEAMVLANTSVASLFGKIPFLYRIHEYPDEADVEKFIKILDHIPSYGNFKDSPILRDTEISPKYFQSILETLKRTPQLEKFQKLLLRTLSKARYSEKNLGHFGLALKYYSHFTSPIRRYPDLQIHRIIKEIIHTESTLPGIPSLNKRGKKKTSSPPNERRFRGEGLSPSRKEHYQQILPKIARQCSEKSDKAEKMEYKVRDMLACTYMSDKIGTIFTGQISGMIEKGFFVELPNTIEGFVDFGVSGYEFDADTMSIIHTISGDEKGFGDEVQVRVIGVDIDRSRIAFELM